MKILPNPPLLVAFSGASSGQWRIVSSHTICGEPLPDAAYLAIDEGRDIQPPADACWSLRATTSNMRYTTAAEAGSLQARQEGLGRTAARRAALIALCKSSEWWALPQDTRRLIFEETSRHVAIGMEYLPAVARRLHHGRDLGEPFDFLTWFEFPPEAETAFDEMLLRLRATREWEFITREVEFRLERN